MNWKDLMKGIANGVGIAVRVGPIFTAATKTEVDDRFIEKAGSIFGHMEAAVQDVELIKLALKDKTLTPEELSAIVSKKMALIVLEYADATGRKLEEDDRAAFDLEAGLMGGGIYRMMKLLKNK